MIAPEPRLTICGEVESTAAALEFVKTHTPDLAIVDLALADGNGLELIQVFRKTAPHLLILVLSMHDEALFAERALRAGAHGYIMKQEAIDGLVHAILEVLAGRRYVSNRLSQALLERLDPRAPTRSGSLDELSDREIEVFRLIGRGLSTATIAEQLGVSVKTIETYRSNIKLNLGLNDATDFIRSAATWVEGLSRSLEWAHDSG
jgi:DNA-binding NarL/FixJ family response regulator